MAGRVNRESDLKALFDSLAKRITLLENKRWQAPVVTADPTVFQVGDMWLNSTTNLLKCVDKNGTIKTITWS